MSEDTIAKYLEGVKDAGDFLSTLGFQRLSSRRKGALCIDKFVRRTTIVRFLFGPPEWHCEVVLEIAGRTVESKDLLNHPLVIEWMRENKENMGKDRIDVRVEPLWWAKLVGRYLPAIG
jgi:hypothetical protein